MLSIEDRKGPTRFTCGRTYESGICVLMTLMSCISSWVVYEAAPDRRYIGHCFSYIHNNGYKGKTLLPTQSLHFPDHREERDRILYRFQKLTLRGKNLRRILLKRTLRKKLCWGHSRKELETDVLGRNGGK